MGPELAAIHRLGVEEVSESFAVVGEVAKDRLTRLCVALRPPCLAATFGQRTGRIACGTVGIGVARLGYSERLGRFGTATIGVSVAGNAESGVFSKKTRVKRKKRATTRRSLEKIAHVQTSTFTIFSTNFPSHLLTSAIPHPKWIFALGRILGTIVVYMWTIGISQTWHIGIIRLQWNTNSCWKSAFPLTMYAVHVCKTWLTRLPTIST
jgi:hypothetical protein